MSELLVKIVDFAWGMPLVYLLMGGGLILVIYSRFIPFTGFFHAIKLVLGKFHHTEDKKADGQLTHLQALTNALSGTVGMGNISGVAVAISQGGPGALFWMWLSAFIGMNTKFFECTLSVMFRDRDYRGEIQGGPMYVIQKALPKQLRFMATFFAVFGLIGTLPLYNSNQLADYTFTYYGIPKELMGIFCAAGVAIILAGGVKSIGKVTEKVVPFMCIFYILVGLVILGINVDKIPDVITLIFKSAFSSEAVWGGFVGVGIREAMRIGIKRAAFSNEAGVGTAPMAHSNVQTKEPISEGLVAMLGPFLDTIIVCTITGLVLLTSLSPEEIKSSSGILMTSRAFEATLGTFGHHFLGMAIFLFATSTIIGMSNYTNKCWNFLFRGRWNLGNKTFIATYATSLFAGAIFAPDDMINVLDSAYAFMAYPNMIATILLAPVVVKALKEYRKKYL